MGLEHSFQLGRIVATHGVAELMNHDQVFNNFVRTSLGKYKKCDWGDMSNEDKRSNDEAIAKGNLRIFASYTRSVGAPETRKIWIITESDRSATTILFPCEY